MSDMASQVPMLGLALLVWTSIAALLAVFTAMVKRGPRH